MRHAIDRRFTDEEHEVEISRNLHNPERWTLGRTYHAAYRPANTFSLHRGERMLTHDEAYQFLAGVMSFYSRVSAEDIAAYNEPINTRIKSPPDLRYSKEQRRAGCVYVIRSHAQDDYYKIGFTRQAPEARLNQIQGEVSADLSLVFTIPTEHPRKLEKEIHQDYADKRDTGEWFYLSHADLEAIQERYT